MNPTARQSAWTRRLPAVAIVLALAAAACGSSAQAAPSPTASPVTTPQPTAVATATPSPTPSPSPTAAPSASEPALVPGDLDGMLVAPELAHRLPLAVPISDNRVDRPQSGFNGTSLVYQAPADGGETRYMFVYQSGESRDIGGVRSGRIYFVHWASESRAAFAHYGGDRQTLSWIRHHSTGLITNLDALAGSAKAFHRIKSRKAPHNAYTSTAALRRMAMSKGAPAELNPRVKRRLFVDESSVARRGTTQRITLPYHTGVIRYDYDRQTNRYVRWVDGKPQYDPADGRRVTTRNVVVLFQRFRIDTKIEPGHSRPVIDIVGTGPAWIFREGHLTVGHWKKTSTDGLTRFVDDSGLQIPLVRGNTFIQVVPRGTKVTTGS
jgi:hypothetical protein